MRTLNHSNLHIVFYCLFIGAWLFFLTYFAVPFFKLLCQDTGPNGLFGFYNELKNQFLFFSVINAFFSAFQTKFQSFFWNTNFSDLISTKELKISLIFKVNDNLPISFTSSVPYHTIPVGKPELLFCSAKNNSSSDIIFTSIYNVYPSECLPYIEKIQCFCYDDQLIEKNQEVSLPIYYRINKKFLADPALSQVNEVIVSYTIFKS